MSSAAVDRVLAVLVVALATTGLLTLHAGDPADGWVFVLHDLPAGALALAILLKLRHSIPRAVAGRRFVRLGLGLVVSVVAVTALAGGYVWASTPGAVWLGADALGRWSLLTLHAWAGLILVPLLVVHLLPKRWRLLRPTAEPRDPRRPGRPISRRALLAGGTMTVAGIGLWAGARAIDAIAGGSPRFTGSRFLPAGSTPIATTFLGEPTPAVDEASWRLRVEGAVGQPVEFDRAALQALGEQEVRAVLDCTSGWAVDATWRGVPLANVLDAAGVADTARRVEIRSVTGWATSLDARDAERALLAWSVGGQPLPAANGAPVRLVVPNRRGLDWVKWVSTIRVG